MKKGIAFFAFAVLMLALALIVGLGPNQNESSINTNSGVAAAPVAVPVVAPLEQQLSQFKGISVYKKPPLKKDPLWINPSDKDLMPPPDPNDKHHGVM